jgi:hypothetical protein
MGLELVDVDDEALVLERVLSMYRGNGELVESSPRHRCCWRLNQA